MRLLYRKTGHFEEKNGHLGKIITPVDMAGSNCELFIQILGQSVTPKRSFSDLPHLDHTLIEMNAAHVAAPSSPWLLRWV
jgi:hypothetical protein